MTATQVLLWLLGAGNLVNGLWMLFSAASWYQRIASDTGPLNLHFVRDIGAAFLAAGAALIWAALDPRARGPLVAVAGVFMGLHAATHLAELLERSGPTLIELFGVHLPSALVLVLAAVSLRRPAEAH